MIQAFVSAIANAFEVVSAKRILSKDGVEFPSFLALGMVFVFLLSLIPFYFWGDVSLYGITVYYALLFIALIIFAFAYNVLYFYALSNQEVCDVEPFALLYFPASILIAAAIFPPERNWIVIGISLTACLVLLLSRFEKKHLVINKYFFAMIGYVILMGAEASLVKVLLNVFSPVALYSIRTGVVALFLLIFLNPNLSGLSGKQVRNIGFNALLTIFNYVFLYAAIAEIGVVRSSLILLVAPVIVLLLSKFWLKENLTVKKVMADVVIVGCVVAVLLLGVF